MDMGTATISQTCLPQTHVRSFPISFQSASQALLDYHKEKDKEISVDLIDSHTLISLMVMLMNMVKRNKYYYYIDVEHLYDKDSFVFSFNIFEEKAQRCHTAPI